jgi:hypothetical protein
MFAPLISCQAAWLQVCGSVMIQVGDEAQGGAGVAHSAALTSGIKGEGKDSKPSEDR